MKKLLLAAIAVLSTGAAANSFAGGCETSHVTTYCAPTYCAPTYYSTTTHSVPVTYHQQVVTHQVYQPCHVEQKVVVPAPCHTTYVAPCYTPAPVYYNYNYGCNNRPAYSNSSCYCR